MHCVRVLCSAGLLALICSAAAAEEPLRTTADRDIDVHHIKLDLFVDLEQKKITGTVWLDFTLLRPTSLITLNAVDHETSLAYLSPVDAEGKTPEDGKFRAGPDLPVYNTGEKLQIDLKHPVLKKKGITVRPGQKWRLEIPYSVREPRSGLYFFGPTDKAPDTPWMVWSQGEPTANRYWFPCVDNPNERQTTSLIARVDPKFEALSNGRLVTRRKIGDHVMFHWAQEKSHVSYLVTLVVGEFEVTREEWRGKPVTYYVPKNRAADTQRTFGRTTRMLDFFSERFGIEYPWEKYAQVVVHQFVFGGMENTSATTLYGRAMHDERAILDSTPDWLIAHELGHQWWGDLVTCKDWSHLWLNEGFATYSEILWDEYAHGRDERDWHLLQDLRAARSGTTLSRPVLDRRYRHPGSMFDNRVYPKGAWVLHMLRSRLGDEDFFRGLQRYGTVYAYQSAETSDLRQVFERLYGVSLERFFHDWTERPGHPELLVESEYLPAEQKMKIHVKQTQKGDLFHIPVRIAFSAGATADGAVVDRLMTEREFIEYVPMTEKPSLVRVDPDFTLLAKIREKKNPGLWESQLLVTDTNPAPSVPERVRAVEHFAEVRTDKSRELLQKSLNTDPFHAVRTEAAKALGKLKGNIARDALIDGLTQEHPKVRRACANALAAFTNDEKVIETLTKKSDEGDRSYFVESALLTSLAEVSSEPPVKLLKAALGKASHRETIRIAALRGLARSTDDSVLEVLFEWTQPDKPHVCRHEAIRRLVEYVNRNELSTAVADRVVRHYLDLIDRDGPRLRGSLASGLGQLGSRARAAESRLKQLAESDPYDWTRDTAGKALEKIRTSESGDSELARLRREVEDARKQNRELEQRLIKLEAK
jgi:aminopeptidase N